MMINDFDDCIKYEVKAEIYKDLFFRSTVYAVYEAEERTQV